MTAETITQAGRTAAAALMIDACIIRRSGGARVFDPNTGTYTTPASSIVYQGPCQVQIATLGDAATPDVEGGGTTVQQLVVKLPVDDTEYRVQDVVEVTSSILDETLVGRRFRVAGLHAKTFATARRLQCDEVTGD